MSDKYQEVSIVIIAGIIIFLVLIGVMVFIFLFYQKKKFQHKEFLAQIEKQYEQELLKTQLEIQEQTFLNISQEIHDNIGQSLSFIKLNINTIEEGISISAKEKLLESKKLLTKVIQDLRDLSKMLNTDFINEIGLESAIEKQLHWLQKTGLYQTNIVVKGEVQTYPLQKELIIYRIVQEVLNNVVKHACATSVTINLNYKEDCLEIQMKDNGKGIEPQQLQPQENKGLGFLNIIKRVQLINGSVKIHSELGIGTTVVIELLK